MAANGRVWCTTNDEDWFPAQLLALTDSSATILTEDRKQHILNLSASTRVVPRNDAHLEGTDDLIKLQHLDAPNILHNVRLRYEREQIYTYTGPILLAVNPWKPIPIYGRETMGQYKGRTLGELPPHIYGVADAAYRNMIREEKDQAILVSGESGAGKTETTKFVMNFLVFASGARQEDMAIEARLLESNPLLEAFGNAKTLRNDNSSRFGKYIDMYFERNGKISGAALQTYLLEKARVVGRTSGETNFHIFYQLCWGWRTLHDEAFKNLQLMEPEAFNFSRTAASIDPQYATEMFSRTIYAMERIGIDAAMRMDVFTVLGAILHLGNIEFLSDGDASIDMRNRHFVMSSHLLQCPPQAVYDALCSRNITARETVTIAQTTAAARNSLEALAKKLYAVLFAWLVSRVNRALQLQHNATAAFKTAVLDIFGFEVFQVNGFEQFCINYANEKLQQLFNQFVFKLEQEEYTREQIEWSHVDFVDNADRLELIEKPPMGVLSILDEECIIPKGDSRSFARKLREMLQSHEQQRKREGLPPISSVPLISHDAFSIIHYAGPVTYTATGFVEKNNDSLQPGLVELLQSSSSPFIRHLFDTSATGSASQPQQSTSSQQASGTNDLGYRKGMAARKSTIIFVSISAQFKMQLAQLMATISKASPHFVRCINPNAEKRPRYFSAKEVLLQLQCGGVMDAVRVTRAGFPTRYLHQDFLERYRCLASFAPSPNARQNAGQLLKAIQMRPEQFRLGVTKVFFRHTVIDWLEKLRTTRLKVFTERLQHAIRGHWARRTLKTKRAAVRITRMARAVAFRHRYIEFVKKKEQERLAKLKAQAAQGDKEAAAQQKQIEERQQAELAQQQQQQAAALQAQAQAAAATAAPTAPSTSTTSPSSGGPPQLSAFDEWSIRHMRDSLAMERDTRFKTEKELGDMRIDFRVVEMEVERERELRRELVQLVWACTAKDTTDAVLESVLQDLKRRRAANDRSIIRDHLNCCIALIEGVRPRLSQRLGGLSDDRRKIQVLEQQLAEANAKIRTMEQHSTRTPIRGGLSEPPLSPLKPRQMAELFKAVAEADTMKAATELHHRLSAAVSNLTALAQIQSNNAEVIAHRDSLRAALRMLQDRMSAIVANRDDRKDAPVAVRVLQEKLSVAEDELRVREAHINSLTTKLHALTSSQAMNNSSMLATDTSFNNSTVNTTTAANTSSLEVDRTMRLQITTLITELASVHDVAVLSSRLDGLLKSRQQISYSRWKGYDSELASLISAFQTKIESLKEVERLQQQIILNSSANSNNNNNNNNSSALRTSTSSYNNSLSVGSGLDMAESDLPIDSEARGLQIILAVVRDTEGCLDVDLLRRRAARLKARVDTHRSPIGLRDLTRDVLSACISVVERQQRLSRELQSLRKLTAVRSRDGSASSSFVTAASDTDIPFRSDSGFGDPAAIAAAPPPLSSSSSSAIVAGIMSSPRQYDRGGILGINNNNNLMNNNSGSSSLIHPIGNLRQAENTVLGSMIL